MTLEARVSDDLDLTAGATPTSSANPLVSRRQALAVGGGLAVAAAGSIAAAGPAAAANDPGDPGDPVTLRSISLAQAQAVVAAALREATRRQFPPMFVVVVDVCGDIKASARQDGNSRAALTLAPQKAATALAFRNTTRALAEGVARDDLRAESFLAAGFTLLGGGLPIRHGNRTTGQVIGAIGVGGGTADQDIVVAEAGLDALD